MKLEEWFEFDAPARMFDLMCDHSQTSRMVRLFVWHCIKQELHLFDRVSRQIGDQARRIANVIEKSIDGRVSGTKRALAQNECDDLHVRCNELSYRTSAEVQNACYHLSLALSGQNRIRRLADSATTECSYTEKAHVIRDITGSPFWPTYHWTRKDHAWTTNLTGRYRRFLPMAWRTKTVHDLAQVAYRSQEPELFLAIADAFSEAGFPDEEPCLCRISDRLACRFCGGTGKVSSPILAHLRGHCPIPWCNDGGWFHGLARVSCPHYGTYHGTHKHPYHVRGCWVVATILEHR